MTAKPKTALRIERAPNKPLGRTNAGRFFVPLHVKADGHEVTEANLVLTGVESEQLVDELSRLLTGAGPEPLDSIGGQP